APLRLLRSPHFVRLGPWSNCGRSSGRAHFWRLHVKISTFDANHWSRRIALLDNRVMNLSACSRLDFHSSSLNATFCKLWQRGRIVKIALFQDEASEISLVPSQSCTARPYSVPPKEKGSCRLQ